MGTMYTTVVVIEELERRIEPLKRDMTNHHELEDKENNNECVEYCQPQKVKLVALEKSLSKAYKALDD